MLAGNGDAVAILWEGNAPDEQSSHTYSEILEMTKKFANVLKAGAYTRPLFGST